MPSLIIASIYTLSIGFVLLMAIDFVLGLPEVLHRHENAPATNEATEPIEKPLQPPLAPSETVEITQLENPSGQTQEIEPDTRPAFQKMTVRTLRKYAQEHQIQIPRTARKKAEIVEYLRKDCRDKNSIPHFASP